MKGEDGKRIRIKRFTTIKKADKKYIAKIILAAILVSATLNYISGVAFTVTNIVVAVIILLVFVAVNVLFDIIGLSVATADERPFHAMASRNIKGAALTIRLIKNAEKVSNICNDVVGDIAGIISGSAGAALAIKIATHMQNQSLWENIASLIVAALIAGLTIGGKAIGKTVAINHSNTIIYNFALTLSYFGVK